LPPLSCPREFSPTFSPASGGGSLGDGSFPPQRGAITQPRPAAWVYRLLNSRALKRRYRQPFFSSTAEDEPAIAKQLRKALARPFRAWRGALSSKPRPLAWAELSRPFGAGKHCASQAGEKSGLGPRHDVPFYPEDGTGTSPGQQICWGKDNTSAQPPSWLVAKAAASCTHSKASLRMHAVGNPHQHR